MKKLVSLLLAIALVLSLVACGGSDNKDTTAASTEKKTEATEQTKGGEEDTTKADGPDISEHVELTMVIQTDGIECADNDKVDAAINEILKEKLNVTLTFKRLNFTDTRTQMNLWLSSGEPCDLFVTWFSWSTYKDYYADLTPYMDLMPDALEAIGDFISNGYDGDQLKGLPAIKDWVQYSCYLMREDYVKEAGFEASDIHTYKDFEALLRKVYELHPDVHPLTNGTAGGSSLFINSINANSWDGEQWATDTFIGFGMGLMNPTESSEVTCQYFDDFYEEVVNMAYRWTEEGLLYDSSILSGHEQVSAGTAASYGTYYKPGIESQENVSCGMNMVALCMPDVSKGVLITNTNFSWGVNKNCANIERACMLLNLLYTDVEVNNLLCWGIEGEHYVHTDDPNLIEYPEGVDASNVKYYSWGKFEYPNNYLQYVMAPSPSNLWEEMAKFNGAKPSKAIGIVFDKTPVEGEVTACQNVASQYQVGLGSGTLDPSELTNFRNDLKANGIDTVLQEAQRQLDAFIAAK